jgi:hypothetical protein
MAPPALLLAARAAPVFPASAGTAPVASYTRIAYSWTEAEIGIDIVEAEGRLVIVRLTLPVGVVEIMGFVSRIGRAVRIEDAHIQGLSPGALGRAGLNAIGRKLLENADAEEIIIEGSARSTGRNAGRKPRTIRFPRR